jgi:hypothetical protein
MREVTDIRNCVRTEDPLWREIVIIEEFTKVARSINAPNSYWSALGRLMGRRAFRSKDGYAGLGPADLEIGDAVCIFLGADVPFVIMPVDERGRIYRIVDEAHVHDIMDGEFMDKEAEVVTFKLC